MDFVKRCRNLSFDKKKNEYFCRSTHVCWTAKRCGLTSYHYVSIDLLYTFSGVSNYRFVLNITDTVNSCVVERFDSPHDLLKYIHNNNIDIELNLHHLISVL